MRLQLFLSAILLWTAGPFVAISFAQPANSGTPASPAAISPTNTPPPAQIAIAITQPAQTPADPLIEQLDQAIQVTSLRYLTANVHSPWQIFHGILALHRDFKLKLGEQKVSAIEWIATSQPTFDNEPWIVHSPAGAKFHPFTRPYAFEGHPAQFIALLAESNLPTTYSFRTSNGSVTIADMLNTAMREANTKEEITWVLWALNHYLKPDAQWVNQHGEAWSIERLVQVQVQATVETGACGGNHGLYALSRSRDKLLAQGKPLRGAWWEAEQKINRYIEIARSMQNSDGSLSADFYKGPKFSQDINTRLNTTGHTFEFLSVGLPQKRLQEPWVRRAAATLSKDLLDHRKTPVECGPLYHSLNALIIYRNRLQPPSLTTAKVPTPTEASSAQPNATGTVTIPSPTDSKPTGDSKPTTPVTPASSTPGLEAAPVPLKPAETKPAETKPAETKPVESKPDTEAEPVPSGLDPSNKSTPMLALVARSPAGSEAPRPSWKPEPRPAPAADDSTLQLLERLRAIKIVGAPETITQTNWTVLTDDAPASALKPVNHPPKSR